MPYTPPIPQHPGLTWFTDIDLRTIVPYIHWTFFFAAWRITGRFEGIETACDCASCRMSWLLKLPESERPKAEEALKLFQDAQELLRKYAGDGSLRVNASVGIYPCRSVADDIVMEADGGEVIIPTLRQQTPSNDGYCYALSDFVSPRADYIGVFVTSVTGAEEAAALFEKDDDIYRSILVKTLADRLAEASAEWLHYKVRTEIWGYSPDEEADVKSMFKCAYRGIRPAVGYPSLPDQSVIFELGKVIDFQKTGVTLTENGAMYPNASVCGIYFAHPAAKYFNIGKIDDYQLASYAARRGKTVEEMKKWLAANLE